MKIEISDEKVIIYLYNEVIDINDILSLNKMIKDVFLRIMKHSNINFFGYNKVNVFHNKHYGTILEVEKLYNRELNYQTIDLKISIYPDTLMYFEFDDYYSFLGKIKPINNKYYLVIDDNIDIHKYLEFGKIKYKKITK